MLTEVRLDLTAASRIHLLEPQWNPAVEDQALARVHRIGQRRPVVAMKYIMKDSIEEVRLIGFFHPERPTDPAYTYLVAGCYLC